jgi:hypothetical protein
MLLPLSEITGEQIFMLYFNVLAINFAGPSGVGVRPLAC